MFKIGDRVKFKKSSIDSGMIEATENDIFVVRHIDGFQIYLQEIYQHFHMNHFEHVKEEIMEEQKINWEVGQEVWDCSFGSGKVIHVFDTQIQVKFGDSQSWNIVWYTPEGIYQTLQCAKNRSLFFSEPIVTAELFPPKKPFVPTLKKGDTVVIKWADTTQMLIVQEETERQLKGSCGEVWDKDPDVHFYKIGEEIKFS